MTDHEDKRSRDQRLLDEVQHRGAGARMAAYLRLSGPGWLQSALTLGAGSLTGSLYLGVLTGFSMLWLQALAMMIGIVMLSAIGYVTLATGKRPLRAINEHVNPVLGYGWAVAAIVTSMVWAMPQYGLALGVLQQNLFPGAFGPRSALGGFGGKVLLAAAILAVCTLITWSYGRGGRGVRLYEQTLKVLVAGIVLCFVGVVVRLGLSPQGLDWGALAGGFVPDVSLLFRPADAFTPLLEAVDPAYRGYWRDLIVSRQQNVMAAAASSAVGLNMTYLFGYSLLRRGWDRKFVGLMRFDLWTGMFLPFLLATSCVVIATATQFHGMPQPGFLPGAGPAEKLRPAPRMTGEYRGLLRERLALEHGAAAESLPQAELDGRIEALPEGERRLAATLVTRDAFDLARSLEPFTGSFFANVLFGLGALAMALSSITLMMVICGQVVCELLDRPLDGWTFRIGSLAAVSGALGPVFWTQAFLWLAVPTSVFNFLLLPIAYLTFALMMNQRSLLGDALPTGRRRVAWNVLMGISLLIVLPAIGYVLVTRGGTPGLVAAGLFTAAALAAHFARRGKERPSDAVGGSGAR